MPTSNACDILDRRLRRDPDYAARQIWHDSMTRFSKSMRIARLQRHLSRREFSERANVRKSHIRRFERGDYAHVDVFMLSKFSAALGLTIAHLIE